MKQAIVKFTGFAKIECQDADDISERFKAWCEDNDIQFENHEITETKYECGHCGEFKEKFQCFEDSHGNDQEACRECYDNWNDSDDNDEDQYRGDR